MRVYDTGDGPEVYRPVGDIFDDDEPDTTPAGEPTLDDGHDGWPALTPSHLAGTPLSP